MIGVLAIVMTIPSGSPVNKTFLTAGETIPAFSRICEKADSRTLIRIQISRLKLIKTPHTHLRYIFEKHTVI
jgi:hypothetical protein